MPLVHRFFEVDAVAASRVLETMSAEEATAVLKAVPPTLAAGACRHLPAHHAAELLKEASPRLFREVVDRLEPTQCAAILFHLPAEAREALLAALPAGSRRQIQELMTYPDDSAGRIMSVDFVAFRADVRVRDAILRVRDLARRNALSSYTYVIDEDDRLAGVINMRDLFLAQGDEPLAKIMRGQVFAVDCFMDQEQVAHELTRRRFFAVPVVDPDGRLLGVVKSDQLLGQVREEAAEDIQLMFGVSADERAFSALGFSLRKRLPWLHVNLATAFLAASVVALFEGIIGRVTALAVFLPVVAGQGGNAGAQSLAVVMRGLVMRESPAQKVGLLLRKEVQIGLVNGIVVGGVTAAVAWAWNGNPYLGLVIGLAMVVNLAVAGFAGAAIPLGMRAAGLDPAQSSNIILTTVTDVVGFFAFLGFAVLLESRLT
jgi:magnesium transporter